MKEKVLFEIDFGSCETKVDVFGRKPRLDGMNFRLNKFGPIKIFRTYEFWSIDERTEGFELGAVRGRHLASLSVKWIWGKEDKNGGQRNVTLMMPNNIGGDQKKWKTGLSKLWWNCRKSEKDEDRVAH